MSASVIAQLIIQFGPGAIDLIRKLIEVWNKPELTKEEVLAICDVAEKSYDDYIAEAKALKAGSPTP